MDFKACTLGLEEASKADPDQCDLTRSRVHGGDRGGRCAQRRSRGRALDRKGRNYESLLGIHRISTRKLAKFRADLSRMS